MYAHIWKVHRRHDKKRLEAAFDQADLDGSGALDIEEMGALLVSLGLSRNQAARYSIMPTASYIDNRVAV